MLLGMFFIFVTYAMIGSFTIFPWTMVSLDYAWWDKIELKKEIESLKPFWLFFISIYIITNIIFVINYSVNSEELKNYSECSEVCGQDDKKMCKKKRDIVTCREFLFLDKKEVEKAYFNIVPECNRNEWEAKICYKALSKDEVIYTQD